MSSKPAGGTLKTWDVTQVFGSENASGPSFAVILLNQPITPPHKKAIKEIWQRATLRLCADGGANRLYDAYVEDIALPHEIRGDLDSIRDDVKGYYQSKGVEIIKSPSEYATDLQKCILRVEEYEEENGKEASEVDGIEEMEIVILGGLSGRLDQTMHTLHVLCQMTQSEDRSIITPRVKSSEKKRQLEQDDFAILNRRQRTWVLSENSLVWVLGKGSHQIKLDLSRCGPTCGLLPFVSQVQPGETGTRIWTEGLRWDLDGTPSAIGGFLSTSNHLKEEEVHVTTENEIIWTVEIQAD